MAGPVSSKTGMVASSQKLASAVGVELLRQGGSAVDAAIGVNAMLNLIEPYMCGLGGDLFAQVWDPGEQALLGLNASGRAPQSQSLSSLKARLGDAASIPGNGVHAVTVPGAVRGWQLLHERFGRLDLSAIFEPVISHSKTGVEIGPNTAEWWFHCAATVTEDTTLGRLADGFRATYLVDGQAPQSGQKFTNAALGASYRRLAEAGFDDFYHGELATDLAAYLSDCDCAISAADLAQCEAEWVQPLSATYRGYEIFELPPNGQGLTVLQMLNLLEGYDLAALGYDNPEYWHLFLEAKKLAFEDRAMFYADPDFTPVSLNALAGKDYAAARRQLIGEEAMQAPRPGDPALSHGDTTYLTVCDESGLMVSLIQSIYNGFGSALVPPGLGFALQCRGAGFSLDAGHANAYAPGKRPFHTIIPAFVMRDGEPLMSFGVMGADMQPQGQVQVLVNMIDFGMDIQTAGDMPRLRHDGLNAPNLSRDSDGGVVWHEPSFNAAVIENLRQRGHDMQPANHPVAHFMGGYQGIRRNGSGWLGASEPRFDGCAAGY